MIQVASKLAYTVYKLFVRETRRVFASKTFFPEKSCKVTAPADVPAKASTKAALIG